MNMLLKRIGEVLFGEHWQTPISELLDVSDRTIRRWANGSLVVPKGVWNELFVRLDVQRDNINHLIEKIKEEIDKGQ